MPEPNNNTEARFWVVVQNVNLKPLKNPSFYAGFNERVQAEELATHKDREELGELYPLRAKRQKGPALYRYTVIAKPA
jgi:hypothetical protein